MAIVTEPTTRGDEVASFRFTSWVSWKSIFAGLIAAICEAPIWLQVVLFFAVSIAALIATRPLVRKMMDKNIVPTNADAVLGREARVTEAIDNTVPSGAVYVDGKTWSARSESGETLPEGTLVCAVRMEGVKLFVERLQ